MSAEEDVLGVEWRTIGQEHRGKQWERAILPITVAAMGNAQLVTGKLYATFGASIASNVRRDGSNLEFQSSPFLQSSSPREVTNGQQRPHSSTNIMPPSPLPKHASIISTRTSYLPLPLVEERVGVFGGKETIYSAGSYKLLSSTQNSEATLTRGVSDVGIRLCTMSTEER